MLLSIIVPVYNVEDYIEKCLSSIFISNLSFEKYEVIVVNDGTQDNSMKFVERFHDRFSNIKIINQKNKGLGEARNTGLQVANGEFVWFIDSDDWLPERAIERVLNIIWTKKFDIDIISLNYEHSDGTRSLYNENSINDSIVDGKYFVRSQIPEMPVQYYVYNNEFIKRHSLRFSKGLYHEDVLFNSIALFCANKIYCSRDISYIYNLRENSIMAGGSVVKHANDMLEVCLVLNNRLIDIHNWYDKRVFSRLILASLGGAYHYWRLLDSTNRKLLSSRISICKFLIALLFGFPSKHMVKLFIIKMHG